MGEPLGIQLWDEGAQGMGLPLSHALKCCALLEWAGMGVGRAGPEQGMELPSTCCPWAPLCPLLWGSPARRHHLSLCPVTPVWVPQKLLGWRSRRGGQSSTGMDGLQLQLLPSGHHPPAPHYSTLHPNTPCLLLHPLPLSPQSPWADPAQLSAGSGTGPSQGPAQTGGG